MSANRKTGTRQKPNRRRKCSCCKEYKYDTEEFWTGWGFAPAVVCSKCPGHSKYRWFKDDPDDRFKSEKILYRSGELKEVIEDCTPLKKIQVKDE